MTPASMRAGWCRVPATNPGATEVNRPKIANEVNPAADQFNSLHEKLIERWKAIAPDGTLHFTAIDGHEEDTGNVLYLLDTAHQAGLPTRYLPVEFIGHHAARGTFIDQYEQDIRHCFKLYPWEWLLQDSFAEHLERSGIRFLEPACGSGNFVVPVLRRKLATVHRRYARSEFEQRHYALFSLMCIYGIELLADNVAECRKNLLDALFSYLGAGCPGEWFGAARMVVEANIVHGDALAMTTNDGQAITFPEWGYLGGGKFQRRDFRYDVLTQMSSYGEDSLFADAAVREIFSPTKTYPAMTVREKEYKSKRKLIQEKLIKFATRIPAFMYLTDFRENTLHDVITKIEPDLFKKVTGLTVADFNLLVSLGVFNATHMNQAVFAFRRYEDASLSYTGIESHPDLRHYGLYDTVVEVPAAAAKS